MAESIIGSDDPETSCCRRAATPIMLDAGAGRCPGCGGQLLCL